MTREVLRKTNGASGALDQKIGVVGGGVVGGIVATYFRDQGLPVIVYDKFKPFNTVEELNEASLIFICVPTPYVEGRGLDTSAVEESIALLTSPKTVVIKSTVLPGTTLALSNAFPMHRIFCNPEFLREKTAAQDFVTPDRQIVGYSRDRDRQLAHEIMTLLPRAPYEVELPCSEAEMIKVATNSFLALKVIFANEIYDLCGALDLDYETVKQGLYADVRLGASHFDVHDGGYRGFGGKCLPKDSAGLLDLAESIGAPLQILGAAQLVNERLASITSLADAA